MIGPIEAWQLPLLFLAALAAGAVNAIAGGGSIISFPTLLWAGVNPVIANATNATVLWPGVMAAVYGFRRELPEIPRPLLWLILPSFVGGLAGAFLLLQTPSGVFEALAPYLVLAATLLMAVQEPVARKLRLAERHRAVGWWTGAVLTQLTISVYGGFFGAGIGILMLATLGFLGMVDIHGMNGLKNLFAATINGIAIAYFALSDAVLWGIVPIMAGGSILGGLISARIAYRFGPRYVRRAVIVVGLGMAVSLFVRLYV